MLEMTLRLHPAGGGPVVATLRITNDTTGTEERGNYDVELSARGFGARGRLEGFERSRGYVELLKAALEVVAPSTDTTE